MGGGHKHGQAPRKEPRATVGVRGPPSRHGKSRSCRSETPSRHPNDSPISRSRMWTLVGAALIVGITIACYLPAMLGGFVWDDDYYVTDNETLKTTEGLKRIWLEPGATTQYYPLVFTTFWIEYHLWEFQPFGYHLVNVLLHALGAVLLWLVLRRLSIPGAWLAAAVFALHPVHAESVVWITERKNVLSGVFYLSALLCYARFGNLGGASPAKAFSWRWYLPALGLFLCALLSKTITCTLPAAILLLLWWKRDRLCRRDVSPLLPFFVFGMAMGLVTIWMEAEYSPGGRSEPGRSEDAHHTAARGPQ